MLSGNHRFVLVCLLMKAAPSSKHPIYVVQFLQYIVCTCFNNKESIEGTKKITIIFISYVYYTCTCMHDIIIKRTQHDNIAIYILL